MALFKNKNFKKFNGDTRITLDAKHNEVIKDFDEKNKSINALEKDICKLEIKLSNEKNQNKINKINFKINEIKNIIKDTNNLKDEINYFLKTGDILNSYYNSDIRINSIFKNKNNKNNNNKPNIIDMFQSKNKKTVNTINNYNLINTNNKKNKGDLLNEYLKKINDNSIKIKSNIYDEEWCYNCDCEKTVIHNEGLLICKKCGECNNIYIDSDKPSYKEPPPEVSYFAYKRINHFNEHLAQFQAKESTEIPQDVFDNLILEFKKERINDVRKLTPEKVRTLLKKLNYSNYYEHTHYILFRINGLPPPEMDKQLEDKLKSMFKDIQGPFIEICPKDRKNFLSYAYILHKFVELLGYDQYKPYFNLLKNRDKLYLQDKMWEQICKKLNWQFIRSV